MHGAQAASRPRPECGTLHQTLVGLAVYILRITGTKWSQSRSLVSDSLRPHGLYSPWNSPGQNTGEGRLSLLQGIFPTQGSNPGLLHCRQILCQLSHKGSRRILEQVAYPFSSGSSWPRNQTGVSCITYTIWYVKMMLCDHILWGFPSPQLSE